MHVSPGFHQKQKQQQKCLWVICASSGYIKDSSSAIRDAEGHIWAIFCIWSGRQSKGYHFSSSVFLSVTGSGLHYLCPLQDTCILSSVSTPFSRAVFPQQGKRLPLFGPSCLIAAPTPPLAVFSYVLLVTWFSAERQTETLTARGACLWKPHSEEKIANKQ